jgi:hypothetical protein
VGEINDYSLREKSGIVRIWPQDSLSLKPIIFAIYHTATSNRSHLLVEKLKDWSNTNKPNYIRFMSRFWKQWPGHSFCVRGYGSNSWVASTQCFLSFMDRSSLSYHQTWALLSGGQWLLAMVFSAAPENSVHFNPYLDIKLSGSF